MTLRPWCRHRQGSRVVQRRDEATRLASPARRRVRGRRSNCFRRGAVCTAAAHRVVRGACARLRREAAGQSARQPARHGCVAVVPSHCREVEAQRDQLKILELGFEMHQMIHRLPWVRTRAHVDGTRGCTHGDSRGAGGTRIQLVQNLYVRRHRRCWWPPRTSSMAANP